MTLEEAVNWCVAEGTEEAGIEVLFFRQDGKPVVMLYELSEFGDKEYLGRGATLIEAVEEAMKLGPRIEGRAFYRRNRPLSGGQQ